MDVFYSYTSMRSPVDSTLACDADILDRLIPDRCNISADLEYNWSDIPMPDIYIGNKSYPNIEIGSKLRHHDCTHNDMMCGL